MGHKPYTKVVKQHVSVNFSKVQQLSINFQKCRLFRLKSEDKPNSRYISKTFYVWSKKMWLFVLFSGNKHDYSDVWMIKTTIKTNQIDMDVCFFQK